MLHFKSLLFKKLFLGIAFVILVVFSNFVFAVPAVLYDSNGQFVAYIDSDRENTIFSASGQPIAYVADDKAVFGFDGKFLGWFSQGILWDESGRMLAFLEAGLKSNEVPKTIKRMKIHRVAKLPNSKQITIPMKDAPQIMGIEKPVFIHEFSDTPFSTIYTVK